MNYIKTFFKIKTVNEFLEREIVVNSTLFVFFLVGGGGGLLFFSILVNEIWIVSQFSHPQL